MQFRSPPPLPVFSFTPKNLRLPRGGKRQQYERRTSALSTKPLRHGWRADESPYAVAFYTYANYCSLAYSVLACFRRGRSGSAFFQRFISAASVSRAFCLSPREE